MVQECTSESGILVGLIDAMTAILNQLQSSNIPHYNEDDAIQQALADFRSTLKRTPGILGEP